MATKAVRPKRVKIPVRGPGKTPHHTHCQRPSPRAARRAPAHSFGRSAQRPGAHGSKESLRRRHLRRVHGASRRQAHLRVHGLSHRVRGQSDRDDRGLGSRWEAPPYPASVHRRRCAAVRLLHPRADYGRQGPARCKPKPNARGREARSVGKPLSLRGIPKDFQGSPARGRIVRITESTA
jgi:hypothetical protein